MRLFPITLKKSWMASSETTVTRTHSNIWLAQMREDSILRTEQAITDAASTIIREEMILQNHYFYTFGILEPS